MKSPKCQTENGEGRKFCAGCGSKLIFTCPNCGFENLLEEKLCGECGQDLTLPRIRKAGRKEARENTTINSFHSSKISVKEGEWRGGTRFGER